MLFAHFFPTTKADPALIGHYIQTLTDAYTNYTLRNIRLFVFEIIEINKISQVILQAFHF